MTAPTVVQGGLNIAQGVDTLRTDQAAVSQAQQTLNNDQHNLQRDQNLLSQGYISQQSVDAQATLVKNDQQALNQAGANVSSARSTVQANGTISGQGLQASAVQQSAAAAQGLQQHAEAMVRAVSAFRIAEEAIATPTGVTAPRVAPSLPGSAARAAAPRKLALARSDDDWEQF